MSPILFFDDIDKGLESAVVVAVSKTVDRGLSNGHFVVGLGDL